MIKVYCDKCGKEITSGGKAVVETTDVVDCHGSVILKMNSGVSHICDECQYNELTCGFKVGDEVITKDGRVGTIIGICTCDSCKKRGFYEPAIEFEDGDKDYIMISEKNSGFKSYYKIGDHIFGNLDEESVQKEMMNHFVQMAKLQKQCETIQKLKNEYSN